MHSAKTPRGGSRRGTLLDGPGGSRSAVSGGGTLGFPAPPMPQISIPHKFHPRDYQLPFLRAMDSGKRRAVLVWHRRSGKDKTVWNFTIKSAFQRVGAYYYFLPSYTQGRKIIWDGRDKDGMAFLDHIPKEVRASDPNNTEMKVVLKNGSIIQVVGSDNIDSVVGTNPVGCVFSEFSLQDPKGWDFVRPILRENGGWAVFVYTPRGKNHGYDLYEMAKKPQNRNEWFCEALTVEDTYGRGGTVSKDDIEAERNAGMRQNLIEQEFYVSFDAAVENAVFADQIGEARRLKRIRPVPYDPRVEVETYWDIGWDDATAVWFVQQVRPEVRLIDYYEARLADPAHYVKMLREKPYIYARHVMPHDADYGRLETGGKSLRAIMAELGVRVDIGKRLSKEESIQNGRMLFPRCYFDDGEAVRRGFDALASWHFGYDSEKKLLSRTPVHNWSSHGSDAFCLIGSELRDRVKQAAIKYPSLGLA